MRAPRLTVTAAAVLAATVLSGCVNDRSPGPRLTSVPVSTSTPSLTDPITPTPSEPDPSPSSTPTPTESPSTSASGDGVARVGAPAGFRYDNGLTVAVVKLERKRFAATAAGVKPGQRSYLATIRFRNTGTETLDLSGLQASMSSGPDGDAAAVVFSSEDNIPTNLSLLPAGKTATALFGFAVDRTSLGTATIEVQYDYSAEPALFAGSIR